MGTNKHTALPATTLLAARVTAAELIHKAATVTLKLHIVLAVNTGRRIIKIKRKRRRIPSLPRLLIQMKA
jgi:hypothetical protein